jgi:glutathione S-transferase
VSPKLYYAPGACTVLDAYALPMMRWAADKLPDGLAKHPNVKAHLERISADPVVRKVLADEGIG